MKKKHYAISIVTTPEVRNCYGELLSRYGREAFRSLFSMDKEERYEKLSKISDDDVKAFYKSGIRTKVYVDETMNHKWLTIPRRYKKRAQYFITQILLEKLKEVNV